MKRIRPTNSTSPATPTCSAALVLTALLTACSSFSESRPSVDLDSSTMAATGAERDAVLLRTPEQESVSIAEAVDQLAAADVVFLGEQHDSPEGHAVQLALTMALAERRGEIILSMEMFERDAQRRMNLYLAGVIDEEMFLAGARPWPNYAPHYRPAIEFARENGFEVVAGNVYRPIAARVAHAGISAVGGDPWAAQDIDISKGEYWRRFEGVMGGGHGGMGGPKLENIYAAQCVKDDTMAESIALALDARGEDAPLVVHWDGAFHSDFGLGTVERLRNRRPDLNIAVVSMISVRDVHRRLEDDDVDRGHFVILVPEVEEEQSPEEE